MASKNPTARRTSRRKSAASPTPAKSRTAKAGRAPRLEGLSPEQCRSILRNMKLARAFEDRLVILYKQGKLLGAVYTGTGNEAISVVSASMLEPSDYIAAMHRDIGAHMARGITPRRLMAHFFGRLEGPTRGKDGNYHFGDMAFNMIGMISHIGAMIPVAGGAALANKLRGNDRVVLTYTGDGGTSTGDFHEGLNFAAVRKLGLILIIENNQFAYSTPTKLQYLCERLADRAHAYGIAGEQVDGNDVVAMAGACRRAVERARAAQGPTLIEAVTMRMRGHAEHDDASYVPSDLIEAWQRRDPIVRFETLLRRQKLIQQKEIEALAAECNAAIDDAVAYAESCPFPAPESAADSPYAE